MNEFLAALVDPNIPFLRLALIAGLLSAVAFGIIGTYVVVKRITSIAGAIAHSVLGGVGISLYLKATGIAPWLNPLFGALVAGILAALVIGLVAMKAKQREDTIINAIWAVGMAVGVLFIARTPGYADPMTYLFGNILLVTGSDLLLVGALDVLVIVAGVLLYQQLQATAFDEEFAQVRGLRTKTYFMILLILTAVTVVLLTSIVGILMVIALLTLPAAVAGLFARRLWQMMLISCAATMCFTFFGMGVSFAADLPTGSTIIVFAGIVYLALLIARSVVTRMRQKSTSRKTLPH